MTSYRPPAIRRVVLALAMAVLVVGSVQGMATAAAKATLRWKFKEGEVFRYSLDQNSVMTGQDPEGRESKQSFGLILDMTWTVKSVDASGVASIHQTIDRVRTSATAPFGKFSFDSKEAGNAPGPAGPMFRLLVGAEFSVKMTPRGEVSDIKLSDKLLATLKAEADPAGAQGPFSEAGLKNIVAQMVMPLAEAAVDAGETWTRSMSVPAGPDGQMRQVEQTFTAKGPDPKASGLEVIEFTTKLEPPKADPNNGQPAFHVKKETQTGRIEFDNAAGRVVKSTAEEDVEFSVAIQGKDVQQKAQTSRVLTLSKDKSP
jgi:Family of unknown function (DUF6263)